MNRPNTVPGGAVLRAARSIASAVVVSCLVFTSPAFAQGSGDDTVGLYTLILLTFVTPSQRPQSPPEFSKKMESIGFRLREANRPSWSLAVPDAEIIVNCTFNEGQGRAWISYNPAAQKPITQPLLSHLLGQLSTSTILANRLNLEQNPPQAMTGGGTIQTTVTVDLVTGGLVSSAKVIEWRASSK